MKILIKDKDLEIIKDFGRTAFKDEATLARFSLPEMQIYLILRGLESYLTKNGINPGFELESFKQEDSDPVDDSGLDEMVEEVVEPQP